MVKSFCIFFSIFIWTNLFGQVNLAHSRLPILVIETLDGEEIPDEPKVTARLGIIWNGEGALNHIDDPFNNYDGFIGIERRGSTSQFLFPKNGFAVETRLADGDNNNVSLLGFPTENDWVLHGPYSDKTLMRNALAYTMAGWLMDYAPRVKFCEIIINGDYHGIYILTERIKRDKNRVDISNLRPEEIDGDDVTGGYILKFDKFDGAVNNGFQSEYPAIPGYGGETTYQFHYPKPDEIVPEQMAYIEAFIDEMEDVLASDVFEDPVHGYRKYFDVEELLEFIFINEIAKNVDGYRLSTFFHKDRDSLGGKLKMGPVWDFNLGFGNVDYCTGPETSGWALDFNDFCPNDTWVIHFWWTKLWNHPKFREDAANYWAELRGNQLSDENVIGLVDSLKTLLHEPATRNFERWPVIGEHVWPNAFVGNSYDQEVTHLRNWLKDRLEWMDGEFQKKTNAGPHAQNTPQAEVYPNPTDGEITFAYGKMANESVRIHLYDARGKFVGTFSNFAPSGGAQETTVSLDLAQGLYLYQMVFSRGETVTGTFLKQ